MDRIIRERTHTEQVIGTDKKEQFRSGLEPVSSACYRLGVNIKRLCTFKKKCLHFTLLQHIVNNKHLN